MEAAWSATAFLGFGLFALNALLAFFILNARPDHLQNRFLAAVVFLQGSVVGVRRGFMELFTDPASIAAANLCRVLLIQFYAAAFILFLSTLRTPWVRPISSVPGRALVVLAAWAGAAYALRVGAGGLVPFIDGPSLSGTLAPWPIVVLMGVLFPLVLWPYGLLVVVSAYRRTPAESHRERGTWFVRAFVVYTLLLLVWMTLTMANAGDWRDYVADGGNLLFLLMMAYGILKDQIFDIDLRLKAATPRTLLAACFVLAIFAVGEGVEALVEETAGTIAALVTAGVLALSFRPLEDALGRQADRLLPTVVDTETYRARRRVQVYAAAVEDAIRDGVVTARERSILAGLARNLGIGAKQAQRLESELLEAAAGPALPGGRRRQAQRQARGDA